MKKLKGLDSFKFEEYTEDLKMKEIIIPDPPIKKNKKPTVITKKNKNSLF